MSESVFRFIGSVAPKVASRFESFVALQEDLFGIQLPRPQLSDPSQLKKFCSGLIEGDRAHPWRAPASELSSQSRFSLAHSLFLFRKTIPNPKPRVKDYLDKISSAQRAPDPDFLKFAKSLVRDLFPFGWDRSYNDRCLTSSLPLTSCAESGRSEGGSRQWEVSLRPSRSEFLEYVLKSVCPRYRGVSRVTAVETGGKWRIVSIPPRVDNSLRPLHHAIYDRLSRFEWLLRGDAKPARFKDFVPVKGEIFVSGDYESATDNLNADLQKVVLKTLLDRSFTIPQGIIDHALSTYSSLLSAGSGVYVQRRGQLMGQLTSFPLLCLINYITFRYSIRRRVPVRINGDDIVFRATPKEFASWERNVVKGGLTLSKGKTLIHSRGFTLNSTPFWSFPRGARLVGFVRSSALWKQCSLSEEIQSLNSRFYSACSGFGRERTERVRREFVVQNQKAIHAGRRSLTRGFGLKVSRRLLHDVGLWHRELYYLGQLVEPLVPSFCKGELPPGWVQIEKSKVPPDLLPVFQRSWADECVDWAWWGRFEPSAFTEPERLAFIRDRCPPYGLGSLLSERVRRMLKMSRSQIWRWVYSHGDESLFGRERVVCKRVWVPLDQLASCSLVDWVSASRSRT